MALVRDVPDFPKPGIVFKDITPLLADPAGLAEVIRALAEPYLDQGVTKVVGMEARGFLLAAPVALALGAGVVPVRKPGKLPREVHALAYDLEYGSATLEVHQDAFTPDDRVLLLDDVLATGGTAAATRSLLDRTGTHVVGLAVLLELSFLNGRSLLPGLDVHAVLTV